LSSSLEQVREVVLQAAAAVLCGVGVCCLLDVLSRL